MQTWHSVPFARVLIPVVAGILTFKYTDWKIEFSIYSAVSVTLLVLLTFTGFFKNKHSLKRTFIGGLFSSCFFLATIFLVGLHNESKIKDHFTSAKGKAYILQIRERTKSDSFQITYLADILGYVDSHNVYCQSFGKTLLKLRHESTESSLRLGQIILTNKGPDSLNYAKYPWKFDYRKYLESKQIYEVFYIRKHQFLALKDGKKTFKIIAIEMRDQLIDWIKKLLPIEKDAGFAEALLLGYKNDLDNDLSIDFMKTGTLHVLAVSGLHVGLIYMLLNFLFKSLSRFKLSNYIKLLFVLSGLWTYVYITGIGASILRAGIMFSMIAISETFNRKSSTFNTIFASATFILIFDSNALFDVGFQLSYIAVIGIVYMQTLFGLIPRPKHHLLIKTQELTLVTLAAQLFTFPLSLFYFHQFPIYFLPANLLIIPLTTGIMLAVITGLCFIKIPFMREVFQFLIHYSMKLNEFLVGLFADLPFASWTGINWSIYMTILVYPMIIYFTESIKFRRSKYLLKSLTIAVIFLSVSLYHSIELRKQAHSFRIQDRKTQAFIRIKGRSLIILSDSMHAISNKEKIEIEGYYGIEHTIESKNLKLKSRH